MTFVDARTQKVVGEVAVGVQPEAAAPTPDNAFCMYAMPRVTAYR